MLDSLNYFIAGYFIIFGILIAYIFWLAIEYLRIRKKADVSKD